MSLFEFGQDVSILRMKTKTGTEWWKCVNFFFSTEAEFFFFLYEMHKKSMKFTFFIWNRFCRRIEMRKKWKKTERKGYIIQYDSYLADKKSSLKSLANYISCVFFIGRFIGNANLYGFRHSVHTWAAFFHYKKWNWNRTVTNEPIINGAQQKKWIKMLNIN